MTATEFLVNFNGFEIGYFNDAYFNNYVDEVSTTKDKKTYRLRVDKDTDIWVGVHFYNEKKYPSGCKTAYTTGTLIVRTIGGYNVYTTVRE